MQDQLVEGESSVAGGATELEAAERQLGELVALGGVSGSIVRAGCC